MSKRRRKIGLIFLWIFLGLMGCIFILFAIGAIRWAVYCQTPKEGYGEYEFNGGQTEFDLDLFPSLVIDKNAEELKVMQIADPQLKFGFLPGRDVRTLQLIENAIDALKPDICVVTGDLTLSIDTFDAYVQFANMMRRKGVYWTLTYGNHDSQFDCSKYTIYKLLQSYENCLFSCGPSDIYGESNFLVNVFKGEKRAENLIYSLVLLDSGMYPQDTNVKLSDWVYDWIRQSQMDWYVWAVNGLRQIKPDVKSTMFFHIPIKEFADMYYINEVNSGRQIPGEVLSKLPEVEVTGVTGNVCEDDKKPTEYVYGDEGYTVGIYYQGNAEGADHPDVFSYVKGMGCTTSIFCGHDHVNTLKGWYNGIYLGYGLCCGYHTYPFFENKNFLTDLAGMSDKVLMNGSLWVDEEGNPMQKGVTSITISLTPTTYAALSVSDLPAP